MQDVTESDCVARTRCREGCVFKPTSAIGLFQQTGSMWKHLQQAGAIVYLGECLFQC